MKWVKRTKRTPSPGRTGIAALAAALAAGAAAAAPADAPREAPAAPERLVVRLQDGTRWRGPAARIDIRHAEAGAAPRIEVALSATDDAGRQWAALAVAPEGFTRSRTLAARVSAGPLDAGEASVQRQPAPAGEAERAQGGVLQLSVHGGRIAGEARGVAARFAARFEGPVSITCAVPPAVLSGAAPPPAAPGAAAALVVDEQFASAPCRPYAAWRGAGR